MELLFEKSTPGHGCDIFPACDVPVTSLPEALALQERFAAAGTFRNGNQPPLYCACKPRARRKQRVLPAGQLYHEIQPAH